MNLAIAIPLGLASAVAYGAAAAVQHHAVGQDESESGAPAFGDLVHDPRWWASIGGDVVGLVLQLAALATGPVVLVQPLFVLCLPIALPIRAMFGGAAPNRDDYLAALVLALGLCGFFVIAGDAGYAHSLSTRTSALLAGVAMLAGAFIAVLAARLVAASRAVTLSAVSGVWFGVEAVLVNSLATSFAHHSWAAFGRAEGLVPLVGAAVVGISGFALSQVAFRSGNLAASFPAMLVIDPLVAVLLGAALLRESVRASPAAAVGYFLCLIAISLATLRLARPARADLAPRLA